ncbi:MAG TPA: DMT family transporter [Geminicoccaceae bacterium]|nr:DMT family transporter [Geminicoccaceae bacterium]
MLRALKFPSLPAAGLPAPVLGALWMCAAATAFALMITLVRQLTDGLHPLQVVFFRTAFGLLAMLPWLLRQGVQVMRTSRLRLHLLRALIGIFAMVGWFTTLSLMPLAEATALSFTSPIFTSLLAVLILGEVMRLRRWMATAIGFLGALIIVRPGIEAIDPAALLAILTAAIWASSSILVKVMARTESAGAITTYMVLLTTPMTLIAALFVWQHPTLEQIGWAALLGAAGSAGHFCMSRALGTADATLVAPFDYLRLPIVALIAFIAFGEVPGVWVWLGGAAIALSGLYITHREARLRPEAVPAAASTETRS